MPLYSSRRIYRALAAIWRRRIECWKLGPVVRVWPEVSE